LLTILGFFVDHDPAPMLMIQPTLEIAEAFSKDRIAGMIRDTPCLAEKIADPKARDSGNTLLHKNFPGGHLTLAGANSPASLSARPIRLVCFDEVDRFPASAGTEGDPIKLGVKRTQVWAALRRSKVLAGSTPTVKGASRIESGYEQSDQRRYFVPCPHCGAFQVLKWSNFKWPKGEPRKAIVLCEHCDGEIRDKHKPAMMAAGQWRAQHPDRTAAGIVGFHIWEAYSPFSSFGAIAEAFVEAKALPETLQTWVNTVLGETWDEPGETLEPASLQHRAEDYPADPLPAGVLVVTAGVDVQADRLELEIVGHGEDFESWGLDYRVIEGDPTEPLVWDDLDVVLSQVFTHPCGATLPIAATAIDAGFLTDMVLTFCNKRFERRVFPTKGIGTDGAAILRRPVAKRASQRASLRAGRGQYLVGTKNAKATLFSRLRITEPGPGYCHFPARYPPQWYEGLTAEKCVTRFLKGFPITEWVKIKPRNEPLDLRVLNLAAIYYLHPVWSVISRRFDGPAASPVDPDPPEPTTTGPTAPILRRPPKKPWMKF